MNLNQNSYAYVIVLMHSVHDLFPGAQPLAGGEIKGGFFADFNFPFHVDQKVIEALEQRMGALIQKGLDVAWQEMVTSNAAVFLEHVGCLYGAEALEEINAEFTSVCRIGEFAAPLLDPSLRFAARNTKELFPFALLGAASSPGENGGILVRLTGAIFSKGDTSKNIQKRVVGALGRLKDVSRFSRFDEIAKENPLGEVKGDWVWTPIGKKVFEALSSWKKKGMEKLGAEELMPSPYIEEKDRIFSYLAQAIVDEKVRKEGDSFRESSYFGWTGYERRAAVTPFDGPLDPSSGVVDEVVIFPLAKNIENDLTSFLQLFLKIPKIFNLSGSVCIHKAPEGAGGKKELKEKMAILLEKTLKRVFKEESDKQTMVATGLVLFPPSAHLDSWEVGYGHEIVGPWVEWKLSDCYGRSWPCSRIEIDCRDFKEEVGRLGSGHNFPLGSVVALRMTLFGPLERFLGLILESGKCPFWLFPTQVVVLKVAGEEEEFNKLALMLNRQKIRWKEVVCEKREMGKAIKELEEKAFMLISALKDQGKYRVRFANGEAEKVFELSELETELETINNGHSLFENGN